MANTYSHAQTLAQRFCFLLLSVCAQAHTQLALSYFNTKISSTLHAVLFARILRSEHIILHLVLVTLTHINAQVTITQNKTTKILPNLDQYSIWSTCNTVGRSSLDTDTMLRK